MAGAALDHRDIGLGEQAQHLRRLGAHVLRPGMAGEVEGDAAGERLQARRQAFLLGDVDDVFADVEGGLRQLLASRAISGRISGHSNFSIRAQDGTSATTS